MLPNLRVVRPCPGTTCNSVSFKSQHGAHVSFAAIHRLSTLIKFSACLLKVLYSGMQASGRHEGNLGIPACSEPPGMLASVSVSVPSLLTAASFRSLSRLRDGELVGEASAEDALSAAVSRLHCSKDARRCLTMSAKSITNA